MIPKIRQTLISIFIEKNSQQFRSDNLDISQLVLNLSHPLPTFLNILSLVMSIGQKQQDHKYSHH